MVEGVPAGGGCVRPVIILTMQQKSTIMAMSTTMVIMSTTKTASAPICF